jgi:hypothetical protein
MAWVSLSDALEMALKRLEIDCAATAGTDADAEKMAAALDQQQPPSQERRTTAASEGDADDGANNLKPMLEALPTGKCLRTASPERVAPPFAVRSHLVVVVDNGGGRQTEGRGNSLPTFRSAKASSFNARETKLRMAWDSARAHVAIAVPK